MLKTITSDHIQSISGMDATFLYVETPTSPMHVGAVAIIEGGLRFEDFRATIEQRIHLIPNLRRRLVEVPLSIDYPYWVNDPYFDLDLHLKHMALPSPGGWKELRHLAASIFSEPLDKSRPLWSFTFLEGLNSIPQVPAGSVAIVSKIHHVAIDGMAGAGILSLLFDLSPKPFKQPKPKPFKPKPLPNELAMVARSTLSFAKAPLKFPKLLKDTIAATLKSGFLTRAQLAALPTAPFTAPPTPLNGIVSARKKWNTVILELDRVKALKNIMGTTLNDVVLAICAGALRRYLLEKEKLPRKPLVAMVPISTRTADDEQAGNK
ncbi:MAG: wax ester/triacylglycerol synthase family O-acyltransferase, partial [Bacteroidetes bacterium]